MSLLVAALSLASALPASGRSLWGAGSGSLITDIRASRAGDLLTILIDEQSTADKTGQTKLNRDSSFSNQVAVPNFDYPSWLRNILNNLQTSGSGRSGYTGTGSTTRTDKAAAQITGKVMRVLDNGNFLIEARRLVVVHEETQIIVVSGIVRPQDVGPDNTVRSAAIADGEIRLEGRGEISGRQQPGRLQRFFEWLGMY